MPESGQDVDAPAKSDPSAWGQATAHGESAHFRPDIEGLRAVAVIAVLLFHADIPFVSGGFIGVDVFYVISGFLITGLLLREIERSGRISLATFYSRRARRLFPAALVVIAATVAMSTLVLSVIQLRTVTGDAAAAALYVSNYQFAFQATDYLAGQEQSPLLHYWSLGVEEQFYLFWPLIVLVSARVLGVRRLWWVIGAVGITSFALSLWLTSEAQPWAFFSLPTRAWELGLGALIAAGAIALPGRATRAVASIVGVCGLLLIVLSALFIRPDMPFPGLIALVPVVGTMLVIVAGSQSNAFGTRLLATRPMRWVGGISYSLYLWHWPILILVPLLIRRDNLVVRLVLVGACFVIAALSTRYIESPFRTARLARIAAPRVIAVALAASLTVAVASIATGEIAVQRLRPVAAVPTAHPTPGRSAVSPPSSLRPGQTNTPKPTDGPPTTSPSAALDPRPELPPPVVSGPMPLNTRPSLLDADNDVARSLQDGCQASVNVVSPPNCVYGNPNSPITVAVLGDSRAAQWLPAIEALAVERGWRILPRTKASCPPVDQLIWLENYTRPFEECLAWGEAALAEIEAAHPAITFVSFRRGYQMVVGDQRIPVNDDPSRWESSVARLLERLRAASDRTVYISDTPNHEQNPVICLASAQVIEDCPAQRSDRVNADYASLEDAAVADADVEHLRPADWICDATICPFVFGDYLVYRDRTHITATFSAALARIFGWELDHVP